ncbi:hypothetical protein ASG85_25075 [Paenibacillus sp. Soil724D2]|nr:hypothetical protein ASG85_25075 [Paenibacillus sp. Soil724D2]
MKVIREDLRSGERKIAAEMRKHRREESKKFADYLVTEYPWSNSDRVRLLETDRGGNGEMP